MIRTRRIGWKTITGSDEDNRGIKHHATNDWFSKKNAFYDPQDRSEYWGRDKKRVKQLYRRRVRRQLNEEFLYED